MKFSYLGLGTSFALSASAGTSILPKTDLALLGPVYLPVSNNQAYSTVSSKAHATILKALKSGTSDYGLVDGQATSFSASVFSASSNETLFDFNFEAPQLNGSYTKGNLTDNTIYRTGSLGKLLTIYTWLVNIGDSVFLDPITKYIPELAEAARTQPTNPILYTNWTEVTVGSLATQLSGIGRDYHLGDFAVPEIGSPPPSEVLLMGYPSLAQINETVPQCSFYDYGLPLCNRKQFFQGVVNHPPRFPSYTTPIYSNLGYVLLGFAYENITGQSLAEAQDHLFQDRLGMRSTSAMYPGKDADAVIPHNDTYAVFSYSVGLYWPCGGQYTSTKDLKTWGQAILNSALLPPVLTRRWMKPTSNTAQWASDVGAPWEIYRLPITADSTINTTRVVDIYSKSGDVGQYSTFFGLVPDYDIGVSVLAAGDDPNTQAQTIKDIVLDIFINGAEAAAKEQAKQTFSGTYKATNLNSSMELAVDDGPGVVITKWISNGTDFLNQNLLLSGWNDTRLYPTKLTTTDSKAGITYRAYFAEFLPPGRAPLTAGLWPELNDYWVVLDNWIYNNKATDAFIVGFDKEGMVQSVQSEALRETLYREK